MFQKIRNAIWWLRYRLVPRTRYHVVKCDGLKPGYHEIEEQMLHSMFGLLRSYVERELSDTPEKGLEHLDWVISLRHGKDDPIDDADLVGKPTPQAVAAQETKELYLWWVRDRPNRIDPGVASGSDDAYERLNQSGYEWWSPCENPHRSQWAADTKNTLYQDWSAKCDIHGDIEEGYAAEDEAMMKRLVSLRRSLWT